MKRFFRALFYYVSGQFIWGAKRLERDPAVMEAEFDSVLGRLNRQLAAAKDAVGGIVAMREQRKMDLERLTEQLEQAQETLAGCEALLQSDIVPKLKAQGLDDAAIQAHPEFLEISSAYQDAETTKAALEADSKRCEEDIAHLERQAADYRVQLQEMQREIQKVKREKHETIADVQLDRQMTQLNDALAGIESDGVAKDLAGLRERRMKARGDAIVSRELSGADVKVQGAKIRAAARKSRANTTLAAKLGLGARPAADAPAAATPTTEAPAASSGGKGSGGLPG